MPRICYVEKKFKVEHKAIILKANEIIENYKSQGYELTLRQLFYQFVSRDLIANNMREYKNLGSIINDARMAGLIDWDAIVDRTRNMRENQHWTSPEDIAKAAANSYLLDKWRDQKVRVEVWIEKDALVGVIEGVCRKFDVPFFSCRGYTSQSEMWAAAMRYKRGLERKQPTVILHLGDHDPSGVDMTRDIRDRILTFLGGHFDGDMNRVFKVVRLALHKEQVDELKLPPNPAKVTDSRAKAYIEQYGEESWELDAMEPQAINALITKNIEDAIDEKPWKAVVAEEKVAKKKLLELSDLSNFSLLQLEDAKSWLNDGNGGGE